LSESGLEQEAYVNILVFFDHVIIDSNRATFYNIDDHNRYIKSGVKQFFKGTHKVAYFLNLFLTTVKLRWSYKKLNINLIISGGPKMGFFVGMINRFTLCKIDHVIWDFNVQSIYTGIKRWVSKIAFKYVKFIVVYSAHEMRIYSEMIGLPQSRVVYKYYSGPYLDDERYLNLNCIKHNYIVSAGFSGRDYRFLSAVAGKMTDVPFVLLTLPIAIKDIIFSSNVKIISGIPEVEYCRYIANSKLAFLPLKNKETANGHIAIVQAMCLKTPLLTNITEGTRDYLLPGVNSMIFPEGDVESTVEIIRKILSDEKYMLQIADNAYRFAKNHFAIKQDIDALERIMTSIENTPAAINT
jgi:glycosyltransferase involved in cell wall biosynthesis